MQIFYFEGTVQPDVVPLTLAYEPVIERQESQTAARAEFAVRVMTGRLRIRVRTSAVTDDVVDALYMPAWDVARALIETAGFVNAVPYVASIDRAIMPDGSIRVLALGDRSLAAEHGFTNADIEALADLSLLDLKTSLMLSDVLMTLGKAHYSPIACGRVADGIARLIAPGIARKTQWEQVRTCLRVDEDFLRSLSDVSIGSRHADRQPVSAELNHVTAHRLWALVGRYFHYRLHGALDPARFPVLTEESAWKVAQSRSGAPSGKKSR